MPTEVRSLFYTGRRKTRDPREGRAHFAVAVAVAVLAIAVAAVGAAVLIDRGGDREPAGALSGGTAPATAAQTSVAPPTTARTVASTPATNAPPAVPAATPGLVLASAQGVTVISSSGKPVRVSTDPARIAYAVGPNPDFVAFQGSVAEGPTGKQPVRVWLAGTGSVRDLPAGPGERYVYLLDARTVGGEAYALVSEHPLSVGPADHFEELVRIRLRDGSRTVLLRRAAWESSHAQARLLPGDEVVGLMSEAASTSLVRRRPNGTSPVFSVLLGGDRNFDLVMSGNSATVVEPQYDIRGGAPVLVVTPYNPVTGQAGSARQVTVKNPPGTLPMGLRCRDQLPSGELVCAGATPVALSVEDGSYRVLSEETGAAATVVRS